MPEINGRVLSLSCSKCGGTTFIRSPSDKWTCLDCGAPTVRLTETTPARTHCANCGESVPVAEPHKVGECDLTRGSS